MIRSIHVLFCCCCVVVVVPDFLSFNVIRYCSQICKAKTDHFDVVKKRVFILRKPLFLVFVTSDYTKAPNITILVKYC